MTEIATWKNISPTSPELQYQARATPNPPEKTSDLSVRSPSSPAVFVFFSFFSFFLFFFLLSILFPFFFGTTSCIRRGWLPTFVPNSTPYSCTAKVPLTTTQHHTMLATASRVCPSRCVARLPRLASSQFRPACVVPLRHSPIRRPFTSAAVVRHPDKPPAIHPEAGHVHTEPAWPHPVYTHEQMEQIVVLSSSPSPTLSSSGQLLTRRRKSSTAGAPAGPTGWPSAPCGCCAGASTWPPATGTTRPWPWAARTPPPPPRSTR